MYANQRIMCPTVNLENIYEIKQVAKGCMQNDTINIKAKHKNNKHFYVYILFGIIYILCKYIILGYVDK